MAIQKINQSFCATIKGNYKDVISLSAKNGLSDKYIKHSLAEIHKACPNAEDKVYLYYRDVYKTGFFSSNVYLGKRCGIKVAKDGEVLELNINPNTVKAKYLLPLMALRVKQLVSGEVEPDENPKFKVYR